VPWLADRLEASVTEGNSVTLSLGDLADAREGEDRDVAVLLTAWRLSEELGAGAADVTRAASATVRSRRAARERTAAVVAGPRASMWLLTGLPLAGPVVGMLLGVGPASLYGSVPAASSAAVGGLLTAAGWWWGRTLLRRAARAARTDAEPS
jgi:tight adherence protein B